METSPNNALVNISKAKQFLAEARSLTDVLEVRDAAVAAYAYATAKNADELAQDAMELKLRSERKAGGFLEEREKPKTGPKLLDNMSGNSAPTLKDLNISYQESSRWQRIASIPEERFEEYITNATRRTQSALLIEAAREIRPKHETPQMVPYPEGTYRCIVIDPPWPMKKIERDVAPNQGIYLDYPTMSIDEIGKLPINELADENGCHIYLWTTHKFLPEALRIFQEWNAKYQCLLTWVKPGGFTPFSWMYNTEHVLFGRIGSLPLLRNGIKLSFNEATREHSRKPDIFYDIVREASPEPHLELFARQPREGFVVWGNETEKFKVNDNDL